jgi:DNA-binding MarR family transcriptional regulator
VAERRPPQHEVTLLRQWNDLRTGFRDLADELLNDVEANAGLAPSSFQVLWFLVTAPEQSAPMSRLAETLGFTTAGTTKVADRLADAGFVERETHPADRRVILAVLTDAGREKAVAASTVLAKALEERVVGRIGADAFAALVDTIGALTPGSSKDR